MNDLAKESFAELFPDSASPRIAIKFSNRLKSFNANVHYNYFKSNLNFSMSSSWKGVSPEIVKGLFQSLLLKVYGGKMSTVNIELYNNFVKNLHVSVPKTLSDPILETAFNRVNEAYFSGFAERPNLRWGSFSRRTLGTYDYKADTITISSVLKSSPQHLLDYVIYHELLHKKLKFSSSGGRNFHHTSDFRALEKQFENSSKVEADLKSYLRVAGRKKRKGLLEFFFGSE